MQNQRRSYLITLPTTSQTTRTAMRNELYRLGAREILPGVYLCALTDGERQQLSRRFAGVRLRGQ
jgi:hypothetical protein